MAEPAPEFASYAIAYSTSGTQTRKQLPEEVLRVLFDVIDMLAENPDCRPDRTRAVSRDGQIRVYSHPQPAFQITFEVDPGKRILYLQHFVAERVQITKPVFISYSHKDVEWLGRLKMFLRPLEDQGLIRMWSDTEIKPGAQWFDEIRQSLEVARVAVFLITQNFLDSEFIREKELPPLLARAKDRGCTLFWVAVSTSTVDDSEIAKFQAANNPKEPLDTLSEARQNQILKEVYDRMKQAVQVR